MSMVRLDPHRPRIIHTTMSPLTSVMRDTVAVTGKPNLLRAPLLEPDDWALAREVGLVLGDDVVTRCEAFGSPSAGRPGFAVRVVVHLSEE